MINRVAIIGCGVIGSAITYELSRVPGLKITLFDENVPASGSTGAALGVLMGAISQKTKGRAWQLRQASLQRYQTLIPELEALTGQIIPYNRQGILRLCLINEKEQDWQKLAEIRCSQGFPLEIWQQEQLRASCPHLSQERIIAAIYSPCDRQINPTLLTQALVAGAAINGVDCQFGVKVQNITSLASNSSNLRRCCQIHTPDADFEIDWLIIAAGLGSTPLTESLAQAVDIRPVLGQALRVRLPQSLGNPEFQPVITGNDVHIVPLGKGEYWIGATVEFPREKGEIAAEPALLEKVRQEAICFCPDLATAKIMQTWSGKRPRPQAEPAPIIRELTGYSNVLLATGHYRNGVLLAPATAQAIQEKITESIVGN